MKHVLVWFFLGAFFIGAPLRAETLPPKPARYFNDYARLVPTDTAQRLNTRLEQFERDTSNQILVAIFPRMPSRSSVEDFTVRTAQSWGVGQQGRDNGAVLFVFVQDRQAYIQVGYGLEGALPDALCFQIIDQELKPRFRGGDYAGGITATVDAVLAATRGEYTPLPSRRGAGQPPVSPVILFFVLVIIISVLKRIFGGNDPDNRGRGRMRRHGGGWYVGGGGFGRGFGGGGGGGGGGFSGGGGSFGGGGAGGRW